jgi:hypothetical protein
LSFEAIQTLKYPIDNCNNWRFAGVFLHQIGGKMRLAEEIEINWTDGDTEDGT